MNFQYQVQYLLQIILLMLLAISIIAYGVALFVLSVKRSIAPLSTPPRVETLLALAFVATKEIFNNIPETYQGMLTGLTILVCSMAIWRMLDALVKARTLPISERTMMNAWSVVLIPPIACLALLAIRDTLPDQQWPYLIDAFIIVTIIPAIFVLLQAPRFFYHFFTLRTRS